MGQVEMGGCGRSLAGGGRVDRRVVLHDQLDGVPVVGDDTVPVVGGEVEPVDRDHIVHLGDGRAARALADRERVLGVEAVVLHDPLAGEIHAVAERAVLVDALDGNRLTHEVRAVVLVDRGRGVDRDVAGEDRLDRVGRFGSGDRHGNGLGRFRPVVDGVAVDLRVRPFGGDVGGDGLVATDVSVGVVSGVVSGVATVHRDVAFAARGEENDEHHRMPPRLGKVGFKGAAEKKRSVASSIPSGKERIPHIGISSLKTARILCKFVAFLRS